MKTLLLSLLLLPCLVWGQQTGSQKKYDPPFNLLDNGNFEKKTSGWTQSGGTFAHVTSGSNLIFDKGSATFDASATSQYIQTKLYTVTEGLKGANCMGRVYYKGGDANLVLKVLDGSSNLLGSSTFSAATATTMLNVGFPCPSSGSVRLRVESTANAAIVAVDNAHVGVADNLVKISQAQFVGSASIFAASCAWAESGTTLVEPAVDTDCTGPQIELNPGPGTIQTTDTDLPRFTVNGLPPGNYMVTMTLLLNAGTGNAGVAISDGTTQTGHSGGDGTNNRSVTLVGNYSYTDSGNRTFRLLMNNTSDTTTVNANDLSSAWRLKFSIYKYPSAQETAFTPAQVANSWSGYHTATNCAGWTTTSASLAEFSSDADCDLVQLTNTNFGSVVSYESAGNELPGITFTPSRSGKYEVCATVMASDSATSVIEFRLTDGTTAIKELEGQNPTNVNPYRLCGLYQVNDVASKTVKILGATSAGTLSITNTGGVTRSVIEWSIFQIDQSLPAPLLVNTIVSPRSGVSNICTAKVDTNCTSDPCTVADTSGGCVTSWNWLNTGDYTVNFAAGTFSATPTCFAFSDRGQTQLSSATSTTFTFATRTSSGTDDDFGAANIMCMGPK